MSPCTAYVPRGASRRIRALAALALIIGLVSSVACTGQPSSPRTGAAGSAAAVNLRSIAIVAAENFYGDLAVQIGGDRVTVYSILEDPTMDPHEYEPTVDDAKAISAARIVIKNGLGYDAFIDKLLAASPRSERIVIDAGKLTGRRDGDNPHVWYDPTTMPAVAKTLTEELTRLNPEGNDYFAQRLRTFAAYEAAVDVQIGALKAKFAGTKVLATEPLFDYLAEAVGLDNVDKEGPFQKAIEEGNDPPASAVVKFREHLTSRTVKVLIYNSQAVTPITEEMQKVAKQSGVPLVPVTETMPEGKTYQQWLLDELKSLQQSLGGS